MKRALVAGGGILGTWHAFELCRVGYSVQHLEAEVAPQGASVRNFGLLWVSGRRNGAELDAAPWAITYVGPDEVVALNPAVRGDVAGGLHWSSPVCGW